jgi:DNA-binding NtrC family response regulator
MRNVRSILVVNSDPVGLRGTVGVLQSAGYEVDGVGNFSDARRKLDSAPPDLLMTGVRLGQYNGLHLIVRSRNHLPQMATILTHHDEDPVWLTEAATNDAAFLILPCDPAVILMTVEASLEQRAKPSKRDLC